jgi:hypothetical protein
MAEKKVAESSTAKGKVAKPKKVIAKKPVVKAKPKDVNKKLSSKAKPKAAKKVAPAPEAKTFKVTRARKAKSALSSYANLLKKENELEAARKLAKNELRKEYDGFLKKADSVKGKYKELFHEPIESAPGKNRKVGGRKSTGKAKRGYSLEQIKSFLSQKDNGGKIKIEGKNATGLARIKAAYDESPSKDAKSILDFINKK